MGQKKKWNSFADASKTESLPKKASTVLLNAIQMPHANCPSSWNAEKVGKFVAKKMLDLFWVFESRSCRSDPELQRPII